MSIFDRNAYHLFHILEIGNGYISYIVFYKDDLLTYKNLQKYATKYIHMYNMKYNKLAA